MGSGGDVVRNARTTQGGFVLVSMYSWIVITWSILIARFVRGSVIHKIQFGLDDATAFVGHVGYMKLPQEQRADSILGHLHRRHYRLAIRCEWWTWREVRDCQYG